MTQGFQCTACRQVLREDTTGEQPTFVSVPEGSAGCTGPWSAEHQYVDAALAHTPEPVGLHTYAYTYVVYAEDSEIRYAEGDTALDSESAPEPITDPARLTPVIETLLDYCAPLSPTLVSVERAPMAGTDLTGSIPPVHPDAAECWRVTFGGTVQATHSDPATHGSKPTWPGSAQQIVESGSWANGAEFGWEHGCGQYLYIYEPGQAPEFHQPTVRV